MFGIQIINKKNVVISINLKTETYLHLIELELRFM
jgi:hypothetical protein